MSLLSRLLILLALILLPASPGLAQRATATETPTATPTPLPALISFPSPGAALQGNVAITGYTAAEGFQTAELLFAYADNPTGTWFLIQSSAEPVANGELSKWDTTTITDGLYQLRLVVTRSDGRQITFDVHGLRVRNYTPIETNTPTPVTPTATPLPGDTAIPTETPTPTISPVPPTITPLPPNPAQITGGDLRLSLAEGALLAVVIIAVLGIYQMITNLVRRGRQ